MKVRRVNRYACEHCKKTGCSAYHIRLHEERCTLNPSRTCGMCKMLEQEQPKMLDLISVLPDPTGYARHEGQLHFFDDGLSSAVSDVLPKLRDLAGNCPACIMAALRQRGIPVPIAHGFEFTKECKSLWAEINSA